MNENSKIESLKNMARQARKDEDNNADSVIDFYNRVLKEDPDDWEAYFFSNSYKLKQRLEDYDADSLSSPDYYDMVLDQFGRSIESFGSNLNFTLSLIKDNEEPEKHRDALDEVLKELTLILCKAIMPTATVNYMLYSELGDGSYEGLSGMTVYSPYIIKVFSKTIDLINTLAEQSKEVFEDEEMMTKAYINMLGFNDYKSNPVHQGYFTEEAKNVIKDINEKANEGLRPIIDKKTNDYWSSKPYNKEQLLEQKEQLKQQQKDLDLKIKLNGANKLKEKQAKLTAASGDVKNLRDEYNRLGFFQGKQKKLLQQRIDEAESEVSAIREEMRSLEDGIKPDKEELEKINAEIRKINREIDSVEETIIKELHDKYQL